MYYLRELIGKTKSGKPKTKTHYKNKDYDKVKAEFTRLCEEAIIQEVIMYQAVRQYKAIELLFQS